MRNDGAGRRCRHAGRYRTRKTVSELQKLLSDGDASVGFELSSVKMRVTVGPIVLTSKLIDGTFPDYARVIPQRNDKFLTVERMNSHARWIACPPFRPNAVVR